MKAVITRSAEVPKGWRRLIKGERIEKNDRFVAYGQVWTPVETSIGTRYAPHDWIYGLIRKGIK